MSETKTERPELSFDGFGINGPDGYRTRLCTFNHGRVTEEECQKYGKLFAASPDLLEACKHVLDHLPDLEVEGSWDFENAKILRAAIARAEGRQS